MDNTNPRARIAQAIANEVGDKNPLEPEVLWDSFYSFAAKAALEAIREPTEEMVLAGIHHEHLGDMEGRWKAMIDAAINSVGEYDGP